MVTVNTPAAIAWLVLAAIAFTGLDLTVEWFRDQLRNADHVIAQARELPTRLDDYCWCGLLEAEHERTDVEQVRR